MVIRDLYRYRGENGTIDTLIKLPMEYEPMKRITASEGNLLSDGVMNAKEIDIPADYLAKWHEIPDPEYGQELEDEQETTGE